MKNTFVIRVCDKVVAKYNHSRAASQLHHRLKYVDKKPAKIYIRDANGTEKLWIE